jgi:hypothetical protein
LVTVTLAGSIDSTSGIHEEMARAVVDGAREDEQKIYENFLCIRTQRRSGNFPTKA